MNKFLNTFSILNIPKSSIVALVNEQDKKAFVFFSLNAPIRLIQLIQNNSRYKFLEEDFNKLELKVLETHDDSNILRILANVHQIKLIRQGYTLYRFNKYKQIYPVIEATYDFEGNPIVVVNYATNSRNRELIGVFSTFDEAEEFIQILSKPYTPITAYNQKTKDYILQRDERIGHLLKVRL